MNVTFRNLEKTFFTLRGKVEALKSIDLEIGEGEFFILLGPSGCGKSTLLRSMNRIHDLYLGNNYEGEINLYDHSGKVENILNIKKENDFIKLRQDVGMIFQMAMRMAPHVSLLVKNLLTISC